MGDTSSLQLCVVCGQVAVNIIQCMVGVVMVMYGRASINAWIFAFLRALCCIPVHVILTCAIEGRHSLSLPNLIEIPYLFLLGNLRFGIYQALYIESIFRSSPTICITLSQSVPLCTILLALLLRTESLPETMDVVTAGYFLSIIVTVVGSFAIVIPESDPSDIGSGGLSTDNFTYAIGVIIAFSLVWISAAYLVLLKKYVFLKGSPNAMEHDEDGSLYTASVYLSRWLNIPLPTSAERDVTDLPLPLPTQSSSISSSSPENSSSSMSSSLPLDSVSKISDATDSVTHSSNKTEFSESLSRDHTDTTDHFDHLEHSDLTHHTHDDEEEEVRIAIVRRWADRPIALTCVLNAFGTLTMSPVSLAMMWIDPSMFESPPDTYLMPLFYTVVFSSGIAFTAQAIGVKYFPSSFIAVFSPIEAVGTMIASHVFLDERLSVRQIIGAVLVVIGLLTVVVCGMMKVNRKKDVTHKVLLEET
jgi:drug/metabolite transporter (DMT)-like permease